MENGSMDTSQEQQLVERIEQRDAEALAQYIDLHRAELIGFLRAITGEHLLAVIELDDLMQEVSTAALTGLDTAPLDRFSPIQWLKQVARRRVVDAHRFHFRAQRRSAGRQESIHAANAESSVQGLEQILAASITSPSAAVSHDLRMQRIGQAIGELSEEQRLVIKLRFVEGTSTKQIAEQVGKTDVAVRVLLSRTMRHLESKLGDVKPTR